MKMNKIYKSLVLLLALSLFSSCYKDHSVNGDHPLAVVEVAEEKRERARRRPSDL